MTTHFRDHYSFAAFSSMARVAKKVDPRKRDLKRFERALIAFLKARAAAAGMARPFPTDILSISKIAWSWNVVAELRHPGDRSYFRAGEDLLWTFLRFRLSPLAYQLALDARKRIQCRIEDPNCVCSEYELLDSTINQGDFTWDQVNSQAYYDKFWPDVPEESRIGRIAFRAWRIVAIPPADPQEDVALPSHETSEPAEVRNHARPA